MIYPLEEEVKEKNQTMNLRESGTMIRKKMKKVRLDKDEWEITMMGEMIMMGLIILSEVVKMRNSGKGRRY